MLTTNDGWWLEDQHPRVLKTNKPVTLPPRLKVKVNKHNLIWKVKSSVQFEEADEHHQYKSLHKPDQNFKVLSRSKKNHDIVFTSCWKPGTLTRGEWWLSTDRQASIRCKAPFSRHIRRNNTPSSVLTGVVSNSDFNTMNGSAGNVLATGEVRIWPGNK